MKVKSKFKFPALFSRPVLSSPKDLIVCDNENIIASYVNEPTWAASFSTSSVATKLNGPFIMGNPSNSDNTLFQYVNYVLSCTMVLYIPIEKFI